MIENPQAPVEFEGVTLTQSVTIDEAFVEGASNAFYRYALTRPVYVILMAALTFGSAIFFAATQSDLIGFPAAVVLGFVAFPLALWVVIIFARRRLRAQLRIQLPIGTSVQTGFTDHSVAVRSPRASSVTEFEAFEKLIERPGFVILKARGSALHQIFPAALFTDEALAHVRSSVAKK